MSKHPSSDAGTANQSVASASIWEAARLEALQKCVSDAISKLSSQGSTKEAADRLEERTKGRNTLDGLSEGIQAFTNEP